MGDPIFLARVASLLLTSAGPEWPGRDRLRTLVRAAAGGDPAPAAICRAARRDPAFAAAVRQLVVEAYADPRVAASLPDPAPPST